MLGLALFVPKALIDAWALWLMWRWFVLPLGAPAIGYWQAMGLDLFVGLFVMATVTKVEDDDDTRNGLMILKLLMVPFYVGIGWVVLQIWHAAP